MKIEHFALNVKDPAAMAQWHCNNLGMIVAYTNGVAWFLADDAGETVLEVYNSPEHEVPDYANMHPQIFHLAFKSDDVEADRDRLISAGAAACGEATKGPNGDAFAMLRDPWGLPLQLVKRSKSLL